ncbi:RNA polymerase sigma-B factor (fragment) [[Clostridium] ultunense Esp]|uniref:RNA polymerase sigma-B factor n=2 Tax=Schnuerera ultunensis TaxID=45497 RepID=A0A1M4PRA4_9FIRM
MKANKYFEKDDLKDLDQTDTKTLFKKFKETRDLKIRELLIERHLYIAEILSKKYA